MPGILSSMIGVIAAARLQSIYNDNSLDPLRQLAAFGTTIGIAIVGGFLTGAVIRLVGGIRKIIAVNYFNDRTFWNLPSDYDWIAEPVESH